MNLAVLLLLAAAAAKPPAPSPATGDKPLSQGLLAVLEFRNKLAGADRKDIDAGYFSDVVRQAAVHTLPDIRVITRENLLVLLQSSGKSLEDCEGECEVDTGRRIGADLVISGELVKI